MNYKIQVLDYFSNSQKDLYNGILELTKSINATYKQHSKWYSEVFVPGLEKGLRKIVVAIDTQNNPIGVALLKNTPEEKKLCCIFVHQNYRRIGIFSKLLKESYKILNTTSPFFTISGKNMQQYSKAFDKPNFKFSYKKKGVYQKNEWEYYYNNKATEILKKNILLPLYTRSGIM